MNNTPSADDSNSMNFQAGDHLKVWRTGYTHHGLATGVGTVVHYAGLAGGLRSGSAPVGEVSVTEFAAGAKIRVVDHKTRLYGRELAVKRARHRVGESDYCVAANNCEHFVRWAIEGLHESRQVEAGSGGFGALSAGATGGGSLLVVNSVGTVAGLSGPGMMSGLASAGFGGAVGGLATLAGTAGAGTTLILNSTVLRDSQGLDEHERDARKHGRRAAIGATAAATAGGVGAVAVCGTTAGLGAAGISSGLAAIGVATGAATLPAVSAMAGGIAVVVGAPAVAAVGAGLGIAWVSRRVRAR